MYGYQLQTAKELEVRRSYIPNSSSRNKAVKTALRYYKDTTPSVVVAPAAPFADRLKNYAAVLQEALQLVQSQGTTQKELTKIHNAAHRALTGITEKKVDANTKSSRSVLYFINNLVEIKLNDMAKDQPELFDEYVSGQRRVLPILTSTRYLCKAFSPDLPDPTDPTYAQAVTTMTASFRGPCGYYASLIKLGYLERKENQTRFGNTEKGGEGQEVALYVNVGEWFFGFSDAIETKNNVMAVAPSFSADTRGNSSLSSTIYGKEHKQKEVATASPRMSSVPCGTTDLVKGTILQAAPSEAAPAPQPSKEVAPGARNEKLEKLSYESLKLMLSTIFTKENAEKGMVRTNANTLLNALTPASIAVCQERLNDIYAAMLNNGTSITQTNLQIAEVVNKIANDLTNKSLRYIYAPEMWLRMDFEKGTLWNHLNPIDRNTEAKQTEKPTSVEDGNIETWLTWLIEEKNIHPQTVVIYTKKHGKKAVAQAAYFAYLALNSKNHKTKITTTEGAYIAGILKNLNPNRIHIQIAKLIEADKPKIGHIWTKWCENIEKNTTNRAFINAFYAAKPLSIDDKTMIVQLLSMNHFEIIDSVEAINLFKQAMRETGVSFKISYALQQGNS